MAGNFQKYLFFLQDNVDSPKQSAGLIWINVAGASELRPGGYVGDQHTLRDLAAEMLSLSS